MKLQGVSVIFALIVLPLILVLTYYIQLQVDTIQLQNDYDKKLLDSTYGAMSAFEMNTANEDLSTVSDSLRTIIEASTNVFMNTLATNMGMSNASKSYLEPYVPAILYTLYDGYYISAPTRTPKVLTDSDGNAISVGDLGVTASGASYSYKEIHTSQESQDNCAVCSSEGHITYTEYMAMTETQRAGYHIKIDSLSDAEKNNYGQLLYLKKRVNPTDAYTYTTNIDDAEFEINHVLKTYMPYSARYKNRNPGETNYFDINVIYTLDNYVSIEGTIGNIYYTKSGYFIPEDSVVIKRVNDKNALVDTEKLLNYNQSDAKKFIEAGNYIEIDIKDNGATEGTILSCGTESGEKVSKTQLEERMRDLDNKYNKAITYIAQMKTIGVVESEVTEFLNSTGYIIPGFDLYGKLNFVKEEITIDLNETQYELDKMSAVTYYVTAEIFSNWIYDNLVNTAEPVRERHLIEISGQSYKLIKGNEEVSHDFSSDALIFNIVGTENSGKSKLNSMMEIDKDSSFYSHKVNVIRDSIQYNLNMAMSTYNKMLLSAKDYAMPVMQEDEWEKILNNISIVAYMQGYDCGLKTYSNYKIVSSTNNEISVLPNEIYYVEKTNFSNEETEYHRIDCPKLYDIDKVTPNTLSYLAFVSKEVKYDKIYNKHNVQVPYNYDHKNLACYDCINDGNYIGCDIFNPDGDDFGSYGDYENLRRAYYIGVGKARNNIYKMNAIENSEGYEIIYDNTVVGRTVGGLSTSSSRNLGEIKAIEIVLDTIKTHDSEENVLNYKISTTDGDVLNDTVYTVVPNVATCTTLKVEVNPEINRNLPISVNKLVFTNMFDQSTAYYEYKDASQNIITITDSTEVVKKSIKFVKVIYR